jgi:hypothetical protein
MDPTTHLLPRSELKLKITQKQEQAAWSSQSRGAAPVTEHPPTSPWRWMGGGGLPEGGPGSTTRGTAPSRPNPKPKPGGGRLARRGPLRCTQPAPPSCSPEAHHHQHHQIHQRRASTSTSASKQARRPIPGAGPVPAPVAQRQLITLVI